VGSAFSITLMAVALCALVVPSVVRVVAGVRRRRRPAPDGDTPGDPAGTASERGLVPAGNLGLAPARPHQEEEH
jgi:hypothetical protein